MRKVLKVRWLAIVLALAMVLSLVPAVGAVSNNGNGECEPCEPEKVVDLIAGQNMVVGTVTVTNDDEQVCVTYALDQEDALDDGWLIYETHLYIGDCDFDGVLTRPNSRLGEPHYANPIPGQFPYGDDELDGVEEWTFCISFEDLGFEICNEVCIAAHAVVMKEECETGAFTPELSWQRSSEDDVEHFEGRGGNWTLAEGFDIELDPDEVVWDGGTDYQNDDRAGVNPEISYATWIYDYADGESHDGYADLRRFKATFDIPDGYTITGGKLASVNEGYEEIIPINDNIYIFMNQNLQFWGGTIINVEGPTEFEGVDGAKALRGGEAGDRDPAETDGWYIPGTIPDIDDDDFSAGENVLDVFAEEFSLWGAMHKLGLTLEYEECVWEDETAWGDGDRFNERGNWGMWFKYKICEPDPCVSFVYGLKPVSGNIYEIDPINKVETLLFDNPNTYSPTWYPNGLAFDEDNQRLYFATAEDEFYFYDLDTKELVDADPNNVFNNSNDILGATFGDGEYWYVLNQSGTLKNLSFDEDGNVNSVSSVVMTGEYSLGMGDIVYDDGVIYGSSGSGAAGVDFIFFTYDIEAGQFDAIEEGDLEEGELLASALQLAWGLDEDGEKVLYGHLLGDKIWYTVDWYTGVKTDIAFTSEHAYFDLSPSYKCF